MHTMAELIQGYRKRLPIISYFYYHYRLSGFNPLISRTFPLLHYLLLYYCLTPSSTTLFRHSSSIYKTTSHLTFAITFFIIAYLSFHTLYQTYRHMILSATILTHSLFIRWSACFFHLVTATLSTFSGYGILNVYYLVARK
jgi:hypothetical protein